GCLPGPRPQGCVCSCRTFMLLSMLLCSHWQLALRVDPRPGCDFTQVRPPCNSTMRLAMARPAPRPILLLGVWHHGPRGTHGKFAPALRPECRVAVGDGRSENIALTRVAAMRTSPSSGNLMALPTRLRSAWAVRGARPRGRGWPG